MNSKEKFGEVYGREPKTKELEAFEEYLRLLKPVAKKLFEDQK